MIQAVRFCQHNSGPSVRPQLYSFHYFYQKKQISTIMCAIAPNIFINAAKDIVNLPWSKNNVFNWRWNSAFGALPAVCSVLWNKIDPFKTMPMGVDPKYLLWALFFLTVYDTEHNSSHRVGKVDKKTYQKWSELFVEAILYLEYKVVSFFLTMNITHPPQSTHPLQLSLRRSCGTIDIWVILVTRGWWRLMAQICLLRWNSLKKIMSHKFKGNGLKYKVGVCIATATGHIVWVHGPSRAGQNDITLAWQAFVSFLNDDEMAVADSGYRGEMQHINTPNLMYFCSGEEYYDASVARSRHETNNLRFKTTQILVKHFCHPLAFHFACFRAVAVITQLNIEAGESLFHVQYIDKEQRNKRTNRI